MLSKSAALLMGILYESPLNAYEITKKLQFMEMKQWYSIADSTVYATIKSLEKRGLLSGAVERNGSMPEKTIFHLTESGEKELLDTLRESILKFYYDTNIFSIAAFFISIFPLEEQKRLLLKRLDMLEKYLAGMEQRIERMKSEDIPKTAIANAGRIREIINAEIIGAGKLLEAVL